MKTRILWITLLLLLLPVLVLPFLLIESSPRVTDSMALTPQTLSASKRLLDITHSQAIGRSRSMQIPVRGLYPVIGLMTNALPSLRARLVASGKELVVHASWQLPSPLQGHYLNVSLHLIDPADISRLNIRLGKLTLNEQVVYPLLSMAAWFALDSANWQALKRVFRSGRFDERRIRIDFDPTVNRRALYEAIKGQAYEYGEAALARLQFSHLSHYSRFLDHLALSTFAGQQYSIFEFLQPLYREAALNSAKGDAARAALENEGAFVAAALFMGDDELRHTLQRLLNLAHTPVKTVDFRLAGRADLVQHFLYSGIIQILTSRGTSLAIGEIKEISDMQRGGSGFSFIDLAADRSGVQFVSHAIAEHSARALQSRLASLVSESEFFPAVSSLPEGIQQPAFDRAYRDRGSEAYKGVVDEIDRRIMQLPLYRP
jgi:hypothetical protein